MTEASEADSEVETVRTGDKEGSPVSEGGQQLESVPETSGNAKDQNKGQSLECGNTVNSVKDKRKERLDRLRELHLRRVNYCFLL